MKQKNKLKNIILATLICTSTSSFCSNVYAADELSAYTLETMMVTATRYEKRDVDIPASTEIFTHEDIEKMGAQSVMEVMQNIPGFVISESPSGNGFPGLRGISNHLAILINGIPLGNDGYFEMGTLSTAGIERIEVVKGGSAVLYGSQATTGVINIITRKGGQNKMITGFGNHVQRKMSGYIAEGPLDISYEHFQEKDCGLIYDSSTKYYGDWLKKDSVNVNYKINDHLSLLAMHSKKRNESSRYTPAKNKWDTPWRNDTTYNIGELTYTNNDLQATAYAQKREWFYILGNAATQRGGYYGLDIQNKWKLDDTVLTAGTNYEYEKSKRTSGTGWAVNNRSHGAVFFLTETPLSNATNLFAGAREVFSGVSGDIFCPQLQVLHKLNKDESVYININKSLREPYLSEKYGYTAGQTPNPDLKPEIGWTYETGWKRQFSKEDLVKFDIYHMEINDRIYSSKDSSNNTTYLNAPKYKNTGVELNYEHDVSKGFSYSFGLAYGNPKQQTGTSADWTRAEYRLGANATLGYDLGKTSVNVVANHNSQRVNNTDPMLSVNMNIRQKMTSNDILSLKINNLLNRDDFRTSTGNGAVLESRNWMLSYEHNF